jgi:hypothetical protein
MNYLVCQCVITEENMSMEGSTLSNHISISIHIRNVIAETKEEAIGKFVIDTAKESFKSRIDPIECFELERLKMI